MDKINKGFVSGDSYYKYENEKGKLRMFGGSWSINLAFVSADVKQFIFETDKAVYVIDKDTAFKSGIRRVLGGEEKLVIPIRLWRTVLK